MTVAITVDLGHMIFGQDSFLDTSEKLRLLHLKEEALLKELAQSVIHHKAVVRPDAASAAKLPIVMTEKRLALFRRVFRGVVDGDQRVLFATGKENLAAELNRMVNNEVQTLRDWAVAKRGLVIHENGSFTFTLPTDDGNTIDTLTLSVAAARALLSYLVPRLHRAYGDRRLPPWFVKPTLNSWELPPSS